MLRAPLFSLLLLTLTVPAFAQTPAASPEVSAAVTQSGNPHMQKAQDKAVEIAKTFTPVEIENLNVIKDAFGIIRAVQVTGKNVDTAVKKCGKDNPEMKAEMDAEYALWKGSIGTMLSDKEKIMKMSINDGRFSKPKEVTSFLSLLDKVAQYADDKMEKQILSTPSSCESLKKSMGKTSSKLEEMLSQLSFPIAVPKVKPDATSTVPGAHD